MIFWITQLAVFLIYAALFRAMGRDDKTWWVSLVHFAFLAMFRAESVGTDTSLYCSVYANAGKVGSLKELLTIQQTGLYLFTLPFRIISSDGWMWMVISGLIPTVCVWLFIKRNSYNMVFSIFLYITCYFYFQGMNTGRQAIGMGFALLVIDCVYRRKYYMSIPFTLLSFLVHPGGTAVLLLIYLLSVMRIDFKRYIVILLSCAFLFMTSSSVIMFLQKIFISVFKYYGHYSYLGWIGRGKVIYFYLFILAFVLLGVALWNDSGMGKRYASYTDMTPQCDDDKALAGNFFNRMFMINSAAITIQILLCVMFGRYVFIERSTYLIFMLVIVLIPQIEKLNFRYMVMVKTFLIIGVTGYFYLRLKGNYHDIIPYGLMFG